MSRFGGDEFLLFLPNYSDESAAKLAEQIRKDVQATTISGVSESVTVTLGVARFPNHAFCKEDLMSAADDALYKARRAGRNLVHVAPYKGLS